MNRMLKQSKKLHLNCFSSEPVRKGVDSKHELKTERRMETGYDDRVEEHHKEQHARFFVEIKMMKEKMMMKLQQLI